MEGLIIEEINVKEIKYIQEKDNFVSYEFKPNFKVMGPKYGKHMKQIAATLAQMDGSKVVQTLHSGMDYYLEIEGSTFKLTEEDLTISIKDKEGFVFESNKELFVALDTHLTDELISEGLARELVNKIQFTRREKDFEIMDRIKVYYHADEEIQEVFAKHAEYIKSETLTNDIFAVKDAEKDMVEWDINGRTVQLTVEKDN